MDTKFVKKMIFIIALVLLSALFYYYSKLDLIVSGYFYDPTLGFYLKDSLFANFVSNSVPIIAMGFAVICTLMLLMRFIVSRSLDPRQYIQILYVILVCAIGPGLIVNTVFKEHFGRARPLQIQEFGGGAKFTPAFVISDQCHHNCSFVSGHASIGFVFFALAFINHGRKRLAYNILALSLGMFFGLGRIIRGAHFLSDVIFSGFAVYLTAYILAALMLPQQKVRATFLI